MLFGKSSEELVASYDRPAGWGGEGTTANDSDLAMRDWILVRRRSAYSTNRFQPLCPPQESARDSAARRGTVAEPRWLDSSV
jgi:hypothetical protein